jgi:hypothetical protein
MLTGQFLMLAAPPAYDQDAVAWRTAVLAAGGTVTDTRLQRVSALIKSLKAAIIWPSLDRLWIHAAENATQALIDLKARATAATVNNPTFATDRGYTGNGASSYINSNFNPGAGGPWNYVRDDASYGGWVVTGPSTTGGFEWSQEFGAYGMIAVRNDATNRRWQVNSVTDTAGPAHGGAYTGFFQAQRTGASAEQLFRNGASESTKTNASSSLASRNFGILAYIGPSNFSTAQVGATFMGASLTGKEAAFYNAMRAYRTAVGVP